MEKTQGKIGTKEFVAIIILTIGTKLADNTPALLFERLQSAAWMSILLISLFSILPIYFLIKLLTLYPGKNLIDVTNHLFGKHIGFSVLFLLWFLHMYSIISSSAVYVDIIGTMYYTKTPILIIYLILMGLAAFGAKMGLESIGSTAWITLPWIKISLVVVIVITFFQGQFNFILPIFGTGQWEIIKGSTLYTSLYTEFLFIALIADKVKNPGVYRKGIWLSLFYVSFEFILALIGYVMIFDYHGIKLINYPYHETIRYIQLGFITNVESMFFPFWLIATFVRFSFGLYIGALLFGGLFKIKRIEYILPALATLVTFAGLIPEPPVFVTSNMKGTFLFIVTPVFLLLPFLLWTVAKVKGEFRK